MHFSNSVEYTSYTLILPLFLFFVLAPQALRLGVLSVSIISLKSQENELFPLFEIVTFECQVCLLTEAALFILLRLESLKS